MSHRVTVALIYIFMLVFDFCIIAGTAYLVGWKDWSAWWFVLTVVLCSGNDPRNVLKFLKE